MVWDGHSLNELVGSFMRLRLFFAGCVAISMSACATIDIADMTATSQVAAEAQKPENNVVIKAAEKLQTAFRARGWTQTDNKARLQAAAHILLKGNKNVEPVLKTSYAAKADNIISVESDIRAAQSLVDNAVKAAEIYLAMADTDVDLTEELQNLERSLLMSRKIETSFANALNSLGVSGVDSQVKLLSLTQSANSLLNVTNSYGQRVREIRAVPGQSAS